MGSGGWADPEVNKWVLAFHIVLGACSIARERLCSGQLLHCGGELYLEGVTCPGPQCYMPFIVGCGDCILS